ncbi:LysR family transcriptional regulator [Herbidospora yilanensis]|uniref:LysR family transcriptional regulator n=1 Tax=Herbidospora yilanensis TaxID=354426 RepID=UPI00078053CF|nr:LysR family transcriptional regulator [Herbidospora yilanensis]
MDVQQLRCFLAVAQELHFGRAAERLHLTPSPVSRAVRDLERELGVALFVRRYHQVELTPDGQALVDPVRDVLTRVDGLKALVNAAPSGKAVVRVAGTHLSPPVVMDRLLAVTEQGFPGHEIEVTTAPSAELLPGLERGELDLALVHLPLDRPGLDSLVVARYTFCVVVRADDPLASRPDLSLCDLTHRTMTIGPVTVQPTAMNQFHRRLREAGITSLHRMPDHDSVMLAAHIRRSHGVTLTLHPRHGGSSHIFADPAFALIPLRDDVEFLLGVAWLRSRAQHDEVVSGLVRAARREWAGHPLTL